MNMWFILTAVLGVLASVSSVIGVVVQQKKDYMLEQQNITFQAKVQNYVYAEEKKDKPEIKIVSYHLKSIERGTFNMVLVNHGQQSAIRPTLVIDEHPFMIVNGMRSSFQELPNGVTVGIDLDVYFMGLNPPSATAVLSGEEMRLLDKYKSGESALISKFHFEYEYNDEKNISDTYNLIYSPYFGKGLLHITVDEH